MFFNVIANKKGTQEWFVVNIEGRMKSSALNELLNELLKDENFLKLYNKSLIESQYFEYYIFKPIDKKEKQ